MRLLCAGLIWLVAISLLTLPTNAAVINEVFADDDGADTNEFIELFGQPGESLDGLSLIVIDNDNGGNTASSAYRRVNQQIDFVAVSIPSDGYFVIGGGPGLAGIADVPISVGSIQNGSQTYALVNTSDIAYDGTDIDELTQASIDAIAANAIDIVAFSDETPGELFDFGPVIGLPNDAASRIPNGVDTDAAADWRGFAIVDRGIELGDSRDVFSSPGRQNVPEPATILLSTLTIAAYGFRARTA